MEACDMCGEAVDAAEVAVIHMRVGGAPYSVCHDCAKR